ncbi:MAG: HEAT repeat domain-containing protein [Xanthomonadales bacterium]|jgi:tetratricopeptide (TPR) repeat protein|nr:HEAT repeat domain-containing protein [Xanthomonadales bacterium]MDH3923641.1 HEAT repeat domain-containing protein [Xanthomonadales bacterium]MDH3941684.1 HEAT repeat domain-containing protein [Xanthomonadales bacterium]MDH4001303.1 HEAT repeat domain-containing protein [Xanthomonadales bacterium]
MPIKTLTKRIALATLLLATAALAQTPYDDGQKALRGQQWMEAAEYFEQAIREDQQQADAALYWRAYALHKAGRDKEAERELRKLQRRFPDSNWVKEGQALRIEYQDPEKSVAQATGSDPLMDDELRLFALVQLMDRDPERALPLVLDLARNADSASVRQDALFVLAVNDAPEAKSALVEFARESGDPEAQRNAIHILGTMEASAELQSLYSTTQDRDTRIAIIEALSIAGESGMLKQVLSDESDPELRRAAIYGIAMEEDDEAAELLQMLYENAQSTEEKSMILEALTMMDEAKPLALTILRTEKDPQLQREAIQVLGIMEATEELADLYSNMTTRESRIAILEAMAIAEDTDGLMKVLETEQDEDLRAAAIQSLAISEGDGVAEKLVSIYPNASREEKSAVIQSMMIMEDAEALLSLLKTEDDPELKREMMQMLTIMDSEEANEYLFELLEKNG